MNEIDREIGLVLLKRLWQRNLISEECYHSACRCRLFERTQFVQTVGGEALQERGRY